MSPEIVTSCALVSAIIPSVTSNPSDESPWSAIEIHSKYSASGSIVVKVYSLDQEFPSPTLYVTSSPTGSPSITTM